MPVSPLASGASAAAPFRDSTAGLPRIPGRLLDALATVAGAGDSVEPIRWGCGYGPGRERIEEHVANRRGRVPTNLMGRMR